jgi:hypothetical protein
MVVEAPMPNHCPVCRMPTRDALAVCTSCETPHHPECWEFGRGCAIFACGSERARVVDAADFQPAAFEVVLDGTEPDPTWYRRSPESGVRSPEQEGPRPHAAESTSVVLVSWLYMAVSLVIAIPAVGFSVLTFAGELEMIVAALGFAVLAEGVKRVGDLIAIGDPRGRTAHFGLCVVAAGMVGSAALSLLLIALCVPFWSRRGQAHFEAASRD